MTSSEGQFSYVIRENAKQIGGGTVDDPFVHSTIVVQEQGKRRNWGVIWLLLRGRTLRFTVSVDGTPEAVRAIFRADYTVEPHRPSVAMTPDQNGVALHER